MRVNIWNGPSSPKHAKFDLDATGLSIAEFTADQIVAAMQEQGWAYTDNRLFFAAVEGGNMASGLLFRIKHDAWKAEVVS